MSIVYAEFGVDVKQKKIDENGHELYPFKITQNNIDAVGDIVHPKGIIQDRYLDNNIILYMHDYMKSIGHSYLEMTENGIIAWAWFDEITELSRETKKQIDAKSLKAASIGLRIIEATDRTPTPEEKVYLSNMPYIKKVTDITKSELVEWSVVTIPMNPQTLLQRAKEKGFEFVDVDMLKKSFGINEMEKENTIVEKAGATLSKTNMSDLTEAVRLINKVLDSAMKEPDENVPQKSLESDVAKIAELTNQITEIETEKVMLNKKINELELNVKNMENDLQFNNLLKG